jgi:hypothetical protein
MGIDKLHIEQEHEFGKREPKLLQRDLPARAGARACGKWLEGAHLVWVFGVQPAFRLEGVWFVPIPWVALKSVQIP